MLVHRKVPRPPPPASCRWYPFIQQGGERQCGEKETTQPQRAGPCAPSVNSDFPSSILDLRLAFSSDEEQLSWLKAFEKSGAVTGQTEEVKLDFDEKSELSLLVIIRFVKFSLES